MATKRQGLFACYEVTIGWYGKERVDYITYDTNGIWRCYEIKVSKSDFNSKAHNTFCGHFNYYVMTRELYEIVKDDIPKHIGVYTDKYNPVSCVKKPKKQQLTVEEGVLKDSMIRSLARDSEKLKKISNPNYIERTNREISGLTKDRDGWQKRYYEISNKYYELKGTL